LLLITNDATFSPLGLARLLLALQAVHLRKVRRPRMLSRREVLVAPVALAASRAVSAMPPASGKMTLAMHQNTSAGAGYRKSLEGWSRAGIKDVEITNVLLDDFLKTDSLPAARRVLSDLGLTAVHGATGVTGLWEPNPTRAESLENLKKRCEMF